MTYHCLRELKLPVTLPGSHCPLIHLFKKGCCQLQAKVWELRTGKPLRLSLTRRKSLFRLTDRLHVTIAFGRAVKPKVYAHTLSPNKRENIYI